MVDIDVKVCVNNYLFFFNVKLSYSGWYICIVLNVYGIIFYFVYVDVVLGKLVVLFSNLYG